MSLWHWHWTQGDWREMQHWIKLQPSILHQSKYQLDILIYPKYWDTFNLYQICPKTWKESLFYYLLMCLTLFWVSGKHSRSWSDILWHLIWVCTVPSCLSVPIFRDIMVSSHSGEIDLQKILTKKISKSMTLTSRSLNWVCMEADFFFKSRTLFKRGKTILTDSSKCLWLQTKSIKAALNSW